MNYAGQGGGHQEDVHTTTTYAAESLSPRHFITSNVSGPAPSALERVSEAAEAVDSGDRSGEEEEDDGIAKPRQLRPQGTPAPLPPAPVSRQRLQSPPAPPAPQQRLSRSGLYPEVPTLETDGNPLPTRLTEQQSQQLQGPVGDAPSGPRLRTKQRMKS